MIILLGGGKLLAGLRKEMEGMDVGDSSGNELSWDLVVIILTVGRKKYRIPLFSQIQNFSIGYDIPPTIIKQMQVVPCVSLIALLFLSSLSPSDCSIYRQYYAEAYSIAAAMTLDQKIGQTIQLNFYGVTNRNNTDPAQAVKLHLGSLLIAGDGAPDVNGNLIAMPPMDEAKTIQIYANATLDRWQKLTTKFNDVSMLVTTNQGKTYDIRLLLGSDAVHSDQHVTGTILFPHNIGLSCSHNPDNFFNVGKWTAQSLKKSGFNYAFFPTVAVSHNPQWGRFFETMGQ
jgi:beta-glucosidase